MWGSGVAQPPLPILPGLIAPLPLPGLNDLLPHTVRHPVALPTPKKKQKEYLITGGCCRPAVSEVLGRVLPAHWGSCKAPPSCVQANPGHYSQLCKVSTQDVPPRCHPFLQQSTEALVPTQGCVEMPSEPLLPTFPAGLCSKRGMYLGRGMTFETSQIWVQIQLPRAAGGDLGKATKLLCACFRDKTPTC